MKYQRAPLIAYLCLLPLLLTLGFWQLDRAKQKQSIIDLQTQRQSTETISFTASLPENSDDFLYKHIKAEGQYDGQHQYLLDNQISKGRAGYFVFSPFRLKNQDKAILVNRGWIPLGQHRSDFPDVSIENNETTLTGRINRFPTVGLKLAGAEIPTKSWPALVQVIDANVLAEQLGYSLLSFQVELDKAADNGFDREWREPLVMTPEKHIGYAVQWFLLALTLTVLFAKYGFKKDND
jgi:surfeit locus 1 family protein